MIKTYSGLILCETFLERYEYLKLSSAVGEHTFGSARFLNQDFYRSNIWRRFRDRIIIRDDGCDLGIPGREIGGKILIHHINPITRESIQHNDRMLLDPENVICVSLLTHQAIHFSNDTILAKEFVARRPGDTRLW